VAVPLVPALLARLLSDFVLERKFQG
jgi:hypothetical protein